MLLAGLVGASCAAQQPPPSTELARPTVTLRTPGSLVEAAVSENRIYGPDIEIVREGQSYRGRARDAIVDLRTGDEVTEGSVGGGRTELHLRERGGAFVLSGLYAGKLGELEMLPDRIVGQLGGCQYDLRLVPGPGATFRGARVCTVASEPTELYLPPSVLPLPPRDRALLLALVLGH
jgi:hypothetical protein